MLPSPVRLIAVLPVALASAEAQWLRPDGPFQLTSRYGAPLVDDAARARIVLFGGRDYSRANDETWEWDGAGWQQRHPAVRPASRSHHGLAYDGARGRVVLFGGSGTGTGGGVGNGAVLGDLWEWDGVNWSQRSGPGGPTPRTAVAMTYDYSRARIVVFGGSAADGTPANDPHWEWDGAAWSPGIAGPASRTAACLAYDAQRNRTVLFGGMGRCVGFSCPTFGDTWELQPGGGWSQRASTGPSARAGAAMTFDPARNRVLLTGGQGGCSPACTSTHADAWEWDGIAWALRSSQAPRTHAGGLAYDLARGQAVAFGGIRGEPLVSNVPSGDTRSFDGTSWALLAAAPMPAGLAMGELAYDAARARVVWFGNTLIGNPGRAETWEWNGGAWLQRAPATSPPARANHALSYDRARQRLVLFGGTAASGSFLADTWEWDGTNWVQRNPSAAPPAQYGHALAYDSARAVTVLYPGAFGGNTVHEYDGSTWTPRPAAMPSLRYYVALAYDQRRGKTVMFGGSGGAALDECWEWDGAAWTQPNAAVRPPGRSGARMIYDEVRGRIVLFGGTGATGAPRQDVWEWDGATWLQRTPLETPQSRSNPGLAFDVARGRTVLFGGHAGPGTGGLQDTWELLVPCDRAGPGEVSGGGLSIGCTTLPRVGTNFCVGYSNPSPNAAGLQFLLLGLGPCAAVPQVILPPIGCASSLLHAAPMAVLSATTNPATFCLALPANAAFVGLPFCLQGSSLESPGCLRASDGLVVIVQ